MARARKFVRASKVAEHISYLRTEKGMSLTTISQACGVPERSLYDTWKGRKEVINRQDATAILRVKEGPLGYWRSPLAAQRMLQALAVQGYTLEAIADAPGTPDQSELSVIRCGKRKFGITAPVMDAITAFYQERKDTRGPSHLASIRALRCGWRAPWYWEEHDINTPEELGTAA